MEKTQGANFNRSLVYIAACDTDQDPQHTLANAFKARAYFAFAATIPPALTAAVGHYLTGLLRKPTFTAEEAYYNMLRIDTQRTWVYTDDQDFNGTLDTGGPSNRPTQPSELPVSGVVNALYAYGTDSSGTLVPYMGDGWLTSGVDEGQIFYLLTAARAGSAQDVVHKGLPNLKACWAAWWSGGNLPGTQSPFCQQWNDGNVPSSDEYDYAVYLLSGEDLGFSGTKVPRFTLNDGGN